MKRMRSNPVDVRRGRRHGWTLVELLTVIIILAVVSAVGARLLSGMFQSYFAARDITSSDAQARVAFERMTRELRQIRSATATDLDVASAAQVRFIDMDGNGVCFYRDAATNRLMRSADGPATACGATSAQPLADFVTGLSRLHEEGLRPDVAYLDLGMSSMQVDTWERGFSYAYDAPLDMRMDPGQELTAQEIVNTWDERRLARLLREYGEERFARQIARAIVRARRRGELTSTNELVEAIKAAMPVPAQFAGGHPARRTFQALRIAVNDELAQLEAALPAAWDLLSPEGRLAVISFHSLEDRRVKRFLADRARGCVCPPELPICVCGREPEAELLTRRAVAPTDGEIAANPRSKSAHLRAARKLEVGS